MTQTGDLYGAVSIGEMLLGALQQDPARPAIILGDGTVVTIGDMNALLGGYLAALDAAGLKRGARIGILSRNRPEVAHVANAVTLANMCLVPLHPMGSVDDFTYVAQDAGLDALVFDPTYYDDQVAQVVRRVPGLKTLLALGDSQVGQNLLETVRTIDPAPVEARPATPDDICRLAYSGGTTGKPKAIMLSQRASQMCLVIQLSEWDWPQEVRTLICAPLSHSGSAMLLPTLLKGGVMVVLDGFEPEKVMQTIQDHRISCTLLVPTMIYALLDHPRFADFDLSSLKAIYYGASSISPARLREGIAKLGPVFFQFYGQSEAPMTVCVMKQKDHDPDNPLRMASCGRPVPWVRVKLLDDRNNEVPDGEPGEICVQGPLVMSGYLDKPEQTSEVFDGGWLHTGDVAIKDPDGFLRIVDRKKDMIITGGFNVYPREIEDVLITHEAVRESSVVGLPDEKWGERVVAAVVLEPGRTVAPEELIALVRGRKGPVQAPKHIAFVEALPLSALGKPDKKAVRVLLAERTAVPA
ncbi:MAG: AMP-binding protein [Sphingobium sp.]